MCGMSSYRPINKYKLLICYHISENIVMYAFMYRSATWLALRHPEDSDDFVLM